ncbi:hypothetical protein XPA_007326 [Xanthoria parietina]
MYNPIIFYDSSIPIILSAMGTPLESSEASAPVGIPRPSTTISKEVAHKPSPPNSNATGEEAQDFLHSSFFDFSTEGPFQAINDIVDPPSTPPPLERQVLNCESTPHILDLNATKEEVETYLTDFFFRLANTEREARRMALTVPYNGRELYGFSWQKLRKFYPKHEDASYALWTELERSRSIISKSVNEDRKADEPGKLLDGLTEKVKRFWDYLGSRTPEPAKEKTQ